MKSIVFKLHRIQYVYFIDYFRLRLNLTTVLSTEFSNNEIMAGVFFLKKEINNVSYFMSHKTFHLILNHMLLTCHFYLLLLDPMIPLGNNFVLFTYARIKWLEWWQMLALFTWSDFLLQLPPLKNYQINTRLHSRFAMLKCENPHLGDSCAKSNPWFLDPG